MSTTFVFPRLPYLFGIPRINYDAQNLTLEKVPVQEVYNEKLGFSRLYTDKEELLVLVSGGYGSAWSSDLITNKDLASRLLMDSRIVRFFYDTYIAPLIGKQRTCRCGMICVCEVDEEPMKEFLEQLGFKDIYLGGLRNVSIQTVPANKKFRVTEYDGCETLLFYHEESWHTS
jgi:hypothetical protein